MKLWITGASGFIGRHLVDQAARAGHEAYAIARSGGGSTAAKPGDAARTHDLTLDLNDAAEVAAAVRSAAPDAIVHLAWYARPEDYLHSPDNVDSLETALTFARAALGAGCRRMIGVGSCVEYANLPRPRREEDPIDPKTLYARCKHAAHLVLEELFAREKASLAWARLFHMHGPGERSTRLIPAVTAALRAGKPFGLSPGEQVRDHLDVRDVAGALLHLATSEITGPVNVCSGKPVTLKTVLETLGRELGRVDLLQFGARPYATGEIMQLSGVPARLLESGWRPAHGDLAASLRETIASFSAASSAGQG